VFNRNIVLSALLFLGISAYAVDTSGIRVGGTDHTPEVVEKCKAGCLVLSNAEYYTLLKSIRANCGRDT